MPKAAQHRFVAKKDFSLRRTVQNSAGWPSYQNFAHDSQAHNSLGEAEPQALFGKEHHLPSVGTQRQRL